jgi:CRP-like cAMP-binding protein
MPTTVSPRTPDTLLRRLDSGPGADLTQRVPFWKGVPLGVQGEACEGLVLIVRGKVMLSRRNPEGESHALYLLGPGDVFGEGSLRPTRRWMVTAKPLTDGLARLIPRAALPLLSHHDPELMQHLLGLLSARLERVHRRMDVMTASSARDRVMGLLTLIADYQGEPQGDEVWLPLGLSQAEIGEMVGLARETVVRVLAALEADGLVRRANRRGVWLRLSEEVQRRALMVSPAVLHLAAGSALLAG